MKEKEAIEAKILKKGNEPLLKCLQSMQFKLEMIQLAKKGLKEIEDKEKKTQDRGFELMKGLHTDSQTSGQGKALIRIDVMKDNFSKFLDNLSGVTSSSQNRVVELQTLSGCIHVVVEEFPNQLNVVKELAREYSQWLLRYTNIHMPKHEELIQIIFPAKEYKEKIEKGRKFK